MIKLHIGPALGGKILQKIRRTDLQRFINTLHEKGRKDGTGGLSARSVQIAAITLKAALKKAMEEGLVAKNVAEGLELPEPDTPEVVPFTQEQAIAFLNSIKGHRMFAMYYLDLRYGLRRGELLGLKREDIDREAGLLYIRRQCVRVPQPEGSPTKHVVQVVKVKTERSVRTVPLSPATLAVLDAHLAKQDDEKVFLGNSYQDHGLIFCMVDGLLISPRNFNRQYASMLKNAKLPYRKPHTLRHTCASLHIEDGEELRVVQELLGHKSISTTANIYVHILDKVKKKEMPGWTTSSRWRG